MSRPNSATEPNVLDNNKSQAGNMFLFLLEWLKRWPFSSNFMLTILLEFSDTHRGLKSLFSQWLRNFTVHSAPRVCSEPGGQKLSVTGPYWNLWTATYLSKDLLRDYRYSLEHEIFAVMGVHPTLLIYLLMNWWRKAPGHKQINSNHLAQFLLQHSSFNTKRVKFISFLLRIRTPVRFCVIMVIAKLAWKSKTFWNHWYPNPNFVVNTVLYDGLAPLGTGASVGRIEWLMANGRAAYMWI